jgi:hypothetical protein
MELKWVPVVAPLRPGMSASAHLPAHVAPTRPSGVRTPGVRRRRPLALGGPSARPPSRAPCPPSPLRRPVTRVVRDGCQPCDQARVCASTGRDADKRGREKAVDACFRRPPRHARHPAPSRAPPARHRQSRRRAHRPPLSRRIPTMPHLLTHPRTPSLHRNFLAEPSHRRQWSRGGRTAPASPLVIAGSFTGQATAKNRSRVSPIPTLAAHPPPSGHRSPSASSFRWQGPHCFFSVLSREFYAM